MTETLGAARRRSIGELEQRSDFVRRHVGPRPADVRAMLDALDLDSMEELIYRAVPDSILSSKPLSVGDGATEVEVLDRLREMAGRNSVLTSMIGMGYYGTVTPAVIMRNVLENPAWYTAYTPYQPEIAQGRLEALLDFQTMVTDLTGMEIANASLLDEGTAAAEAMTMCKRLTTLDSDVFFVDADCHPQTIAVVRTRAAPLGIEVVVGDPEHDLARVDPYGVLLQYPGSSGAIRDHRALVADVHAAGGLVAVAADLLALTLLTPPGELGADVVVGSSQRFGVPMFFGGPHAAFMATREAFVRSVPGRLVGVTVDARGRPALRLAMQTREQHIRREKATSNICTAQVLLAVVAAMYACYHGPDGLRTIAERVNRLAGVFAEGLREAGLEPVYDHFFDTVTVRVAGRADELTARTLAAGINIRRVDGDTVGVSFDETSGRDTVAVLWEAFGVEGVTVEGLDARVEESIPPDLRRTSPFLTHPVFHRYHSETEMLRYLRKLADADVALDRSMIPLGSCTMKLNATTEMLPVSWPEFADLHPFVPLDQAEGYLELIAELEAMLADLTGYDAVSLQPNAGSQGEYAGLLAIRAYHESRGEGHRNVCLIPASAHGTNPASATMAGLKVVVVACDEHGNVDVDDLRTRVEEHGESLAALMVTYPSTHGVFEAEIVEICEIVHEAGGQVYLDGANLNAMLGIARPGEFGSDVSHLNLHKTFTIPHGGGGPGVGPIGVRAHLAPFLPGDPRGGDPHGGGSPVGAVSASRWGSAGILTISWAYIAMMGNEGLRHATDIAILNANYVARRLEPHFPILYTGGGGLVAHECIIDLRPLHKTTGVTVDDVAKRLMDYGFHAPTMSFPVAGTLMIEPTESESKAELDRFCEAMIGIRREIARVADGEVAIEDSVLRHAPHTAEDLLVDEWTRPYEREEAAYPVPGLREAKYWPPVGRVDNTYGDRHLMCSCLPIEAYQDD